MQIHKLEAEFQEIGVIGLRPHKFDTIRKLQRSKLGENIGFGVIYSFKATSSHISISLNKKKEKNETDERWD